MRSEGTKIKRYPRVLSNPPFIYSSVTRFKGSLDLTMNSRLLSVLVFIRLISKPLVVWTYSEWLLMSRRTQVVCSTLLPLALSPKAKAIGRQHGSGWKMLRKSERVNQRREKIYSRLTVLELRMDELVEKVQRLKTKYNMMD